MNVLITGAASGIGRAATEQFLREGHCVFGIDRVPVPSKEGFCGFQGDIMDEASLLAIRTRLLEMGIVLDAVLNVAGVHQMASLVETDFAAMKKVVDINLSGTMLVNRVFHSCLSPKGRIIVVTSEVAGFDPMPFNGLYSVTKIALDAYAQALRQEVNLLGQKVITVRPGAVKTPLAVGSVEATQNLAETTKLYKKQAGRFVGLAARFMGKPIAPEAVAKLLYKAATVKHPILTYKKHHNLGLVLLNLLPKRWQCALVKGLLG